MTENDERQQDRPSNQLLIRKGISQVSIKDTWGPIVLESYLSQLLVRIVPKLFDSSETDPMSKGKEIEPSATI